MERIYLDHGATTPMNPIVIEKMTEIMATVYGNPSSIHQQGQTAHGLMEKSRGVVAKSLNAKEHEIVFTSGGAESDNDAIIQTALARRAEGNHLITTAVEHPAVLKSMAYLETLGYEVTYLPIDDKGAFSLESLKEALRDETILVSIMATNNEIGMRFPLKEIGQLLQDHSAYFHTDAVQAYGLENLDVENLSLDLLSATAHKINGPKGVGFLYRRDGLKSVPLIHGGDQEEKRRAGTENLPGIVGLATAVSLLSAEVKAERKSLYQGFTKQLLEALTEGKVEFQVNGNLNLNSPHILNLWLKGIPNDLVLMHLDLQGISLSIGSACTAGNVEPSHVLETMYGKGHPSTKESLRISYGMNNTEAEIATFAEKLIGVINRLK